MIMNNKSDIQNIEFYDISDNLLSSNERIENWQNFPVVMKFHTKSEFESGANSYALNFNTGFQIDQDA